MRTSTIGLLMLSVTVNASALGASSKQSANGSAEPQIRAALCDLEKGDYAAAQKRIEQVLQSDSKNIYAQKVLLGILTQQVKPGDQSPENVVRVTKVIEAYKQAMNNVQFTADERRHMDAYLLSLYRYLGEDRMTEELRRRATDSRRTAKERAEVYSVLASRSWNCSYGITSGKNTPDKSQIEKAGQCVEAGLADVQHALDLDGANDAGWSYKASLLREGAALAGFQNNQALKTRYQAQASEAQKRSTELYANQQAENEKQTAKQEDQKQKSDSFTPPEAQKLSQELVEEKRETSLDEAVNRVFVPLLELTTLVAPVPIPEEKTEGTSARDSRPAQPVQKGCFREVDGPAQVQETRAWKTFAPEDEEIAADLPDNVCKSVGGYTAASEGVMYSLTSIPRHAAVVGRAGDDGALNTVARIYLGLAASAWLSRGSANRFEMKLLRKEQVSGQPQKVYSYVRVSCSERQEGVLIVHASSSHYYTIDILGANESDARAQHFMKSATFK
jgi:hypothetical protein